MIRHAEILTLIIFRFVEKKKTLFLHAIQKYPLLLSGARNFHAIYPFIAIFNNVVKISLHRTFQSVAVDVCFCRLLNTP